MTAPSSIFRRLSSIPGRGLRALGRGSRKAWKPVLIGFLALNAVHDLSDYVERKLIPPPLITLPPWDKAKYLSPINPCRHYEAAYVLIPNDAAAVLDTTTAEQYIRYLETGQPIDPQETQHVSVDSVLKALPLVQPAIREVERGASCPVDRLEFPRDLYSVWTLRFNTTYSTLRRLARIVALDARYKTIQGRSAEAGEELLAVARMGDDITRSHGLFGFLVGQTFQAIASRQLLSMVGKPGLGPQDYRKIARQLESIKSHRLSLGPVFEGEYALKRDALVDILWASYEDTQKMLDPYGLHPPKFLKRLHLYKSIPGMKTATSNRFDCAWATTLDEYERPYPDAIGGPARKEIHAYEYVGPGFFPYSNNRFAQRYASYSAINDGLMLQAALEAYRLEHGQYPGTLGELVGDYISKVPADPFTNNQPFIYSRKADDYLLYSVGPDMTDDGGKVVRPYYLLTQEEKPERGDLLFAPGLDLWARQ